MSKFSIDYNFLDQETSEKKQFKLSKAEVDRIFIKVAFDVVMFRDGDKDQLWQLQPADDGKEYIVSLYAEDPENIKMAKNTSKTVWAATLNGNSTEINLFYKSEPITKISANKLNIPQSELSLVSEYLPIKLAEDKNLVKSLLSDLPNDQKRDILSKYPELG